MPSLDDFLNKKNEKVIEDLDLIDGSFSCQNSDCNILTYEAFHDRAHNKIKWTCLNGHDSSVQL
jgi:hypothetical protein